MSYLRYLVRRLGFAVVSVYVAVTAMFVLANFMWKYYLRNIIARAEYGGASPAELREIRRGFIQARGLDEPVHVRYVDWLVDVTTLDWGYSFVYRRPVVDVLGDPVVTSLEYVVPGVALAVVLGVVLGLMAALLKDGVFDWSVRLAVYVLFAVPAFVVVFYVVYAVAELGGQPMADSLLADHRQAFAALVVAGSLLAGQVRFVRTSSLEQTGEEFVKLLRAKGARRRDVARHVLRNASLPVVSMSTSEVVSVLALDIYVVEEVLGIDGLASVVLVAVRRGDVPVLIWSTLVVVVVGIAGNLFADALYGYLDPRVRTG